MDNHEFENIKKKLRLTNQGVSDVMGVRLKTVQCWADGIWEIPLMAEKFLRTLLSVDRGEAAYTTGYATGYLEGRDKGRSEQVEGYTAGYDTGYLTGKAEGRREEQNKGRFSAGFVAGHNIGYNAGVQAQGIK